MRSRLHSVLTLLVACLMLTAGTQGAVCELVCNFGSAQCISASMATAGSQQTSGAMAGMHCSGMMDDRASDSSESNAQFVASKTGPCVHAAQVVALNSDASNDDGAVHWIVVEAVHVQAVTSTPRDGLITSSPPTHPPLSSLFLPLRV